MSLKSTTTDTIIKQMEQVFTPFGYPHALVSEMAHNSHLMALSFIFKHIILNVS